MTTHDLTPKSEPDSGLIVHQVLAVSYAVYLVSIFVGFVVEQFWDIKFTSSAFLPIGFICILLGTGVSFWAQYVSGKTSHVRNSQKDTLNHTHFLVGPYTITRSPTQYGLLLMALGLAFLYGSFVMFCMTVIAFVLGKFVFIPMEEHHLAKKYGESYKEYKKKVRF